MIPILVAENRVIVKCLSYMGTVDDYQTFFPARKRSDTLGGKTSALRSLRL